MHADGSELIRRALVAEGLFCAGAGVLVAVLADWLAGELPVASGWVIAAASVTVIWGVLLVVAAQSLPNRGPLVLVAATNIVTVLAAVGWVAIDGEKMSGIGIAVIGILAVAVARFAIHQVTLLRQ